MLLRFLGHVDCDQAVYCSGVARDLACSAQAYSQDVERDGEGGLVAEEDERAGCEGGVDEEERGDVSVYEDVDSGD